ncbi:MAG TPA: hypothetical protein VM095_11990, partial [Pyrinomonadaceae bacterium]|nr:hypothetical protein [Pyrinomonadaceae bacterium]
MPFRTIFLLALVISFNIAAAAQSKEPVSVPPTPVDPISADKNSRNRNSGIMVGSPEEEMMARRDVRAAEKDHEENVERAREAAQLSTEIRDSFLHNKSFSRTEEKKLERLEKITRKIRSEAGGSDGDEALENPPAQIEPALARLAEISDKMRNGVEKTPRQVISTSVIRQANELLELIRYIR